MVTEESFDWGHWCPPEGVESIPDNTIGFVYKITDKSSGKYYIGCKQTYKKIRRKPLKGKKRVRIDYKDSDWRTYCSSSGVIAESVKDNESNFKFEILSFHESKTSLKIEETRQILNNVYDPKCYNEVINIRLRVLK